ncbi:hypothetical protein BgiBS90_032235 [Biomphalaria glabrata]|nr:hypothetical protein BgiBS90_032235 [Biomphalaria glabrata]
MADYETNEEEEEVEVYVKIRFRIESWDGTVKEHEADLPGSVKIKDLKDELRDELGDPETKEWFLVKQNGGEKHMPDDDVINELCSDLLGDDLLIVSVRDNRTDFTSDVIPVMEQGH